MHVPFEALMNLATAIMLLVAALLPFLKKEVSPGQEHDRCQFINPLNRRFPPNSKHGVRFQLLWPGDTQGLVNAGKIIAHEMPVNCRLMVFDLLGKGVCQA